MVGMWFVRGDLQRGGNAVFFASSPGKKEFLSLFGMPLTEDDTSALHVGADFAAYKYELSYYRGRASRFAMWSMWLPGAPPPCRPIPPDLERLAFEGRVYRERHFAGKPLVLLFPRCSWSPREWPKAHYLDLAWTLEGMGISTVTMVEGDQAEWSSTFPFRIWGASWRDLARWCLAADLVVGNDSGPAHFCGTLNVPTLTLMGPNGNLFGDYGSVQEVRGHLPCSPCFFSSDHGYRAACDCHCQALASISPGAIVQMVSRRLGVPLKGSKPPPPETVPPRITLTCSVRDLPGPPPVSFPV